MQRLNGWRRLWIVLSVLYAAAVVIFVANTVSDSDNYSDRMSASYTLQAFADLPQDLPQIKALSLDNQREFAIDKARARRSLKEGRSHADNQTDEEFVRGISKKWEGLIDFARIDAERQTRLEQLTSSKLEQIGYGFLAWVVPVVLVYILGLSVGWIIGGFRGDRP